MLKKLSILVLMLVVLLIKPVSAEFTKESAFNAIKNAESVISEMQKTGFGVTYANDTLNEAKLLFAQERYMAAETIAGKVLEIKDKAIKVDELIDAVESRIYDLSSKGYDVTAAQALFDSGLSEFKVDNYIESESIMNQVMSKLDETEAKESIKKAGETTGLNFLPVLLDYLWLIIILFLIILIFGLKVKKISKKRKIKIKIKRLEKERDGTIDRIKEMQKKYFERGAISKMDYEASLDKHNKRVDEIKNELSVLMENSR